MQNTENALDNYIDMIDNYSDSLVMKKKIMSKNSYNFGIFLFTPMSQNQP